MAKREFDYEEFAKKCKMRCEQTIMSKITYVPNSPYMAYSQGVTHTLMWLLEYLNECEQEVEKQSENK